MATLREVREAVFPAATPIGAPPPERLEAVVGWVRLLRARVPAFDALEPGDLVIVPASALPLVAPSAVERRELVAAFAAARLSGMLVAAMPDPAGSDPGSAADSPEAVLAAETAAAGIPVFRATGVEPGILERSLIGFLVNRRGELELQAARLEERLQALALRRADLQALVAEIAAFLGRAVAIEGRRGDRLAVHASADDPSAAAAVARYLSGSAAAALRVPLPATGERSAGERPAGDGTAGSAAMASGPAGRTAPDPERTAAGTLVLLGDRPATELERIAGSRIAGALALDLARDEAIRRAHDTARSEQLPADGPPWVVLVARQIRPGDASTSAAREETRRELRLLAPARRLALRGSAESLELRAVLAADAGDPSALDLAGRIAAFLGRTVAVSRPFREPVERPGAEADARATLEAVEAVGALDGGWLAPPVARADRLSAYRALGALHNIPDGPRLARSLLAPILAGRPSAVRERLATLRAVLDAPGPAEAAATLGIHRNTLAYRIRRIEALSGWRLTDPSLRLPLSMAVRLVQEAQEQDPVGRL